MKPKPKPDSRVQDTGQHVKRGSVKMTPRTQPPRHAKNTK